MKAIADRIGKDRQTVHRIAQKPDVPVRDKYAVELHHTYGEYLDTIIDRLEIVHELNKKGITPALFVYHDELQCQANNDLDLSLEQHTALIGLLDFSIQLLNQVNGWDLQATIQYKPADTPAEGEDEA